MEKEDSSKNSITIYQATRRYIPEDRDLNIYCANINLNLRKPITAQLVLISNLHRVVILYSFFSVIPGVWILYADVSEHSVCSIFIGRLDQTYEDGTERSVT